MTTIARTLVVESVEPGFSDPMRVHAVVTVRDPAGTDGALHLFTSDPALAACLVAGAELEIRAELPRRTHVIRRGAPGAYRWLATAPMTGAPILWTEDEAEAAHFMGRATALEDAHLCAVAGWAVSVLPYG